MEFKYQNSPSLFTYLDNIMEASTIQCFCVHLALYYYSVALLSLPIIAHANSVGCPPSFRLIQVHRLSPVRCLQHAFLIAIGLHSALSNLVSDLSVIRNYLTSIGEYFYDRLIIYWHFIIFICLFPPPPPKGNLVY